MYEWVAEFNPPENHDEYSVPSTVDDVESSEGCSESSYTQYGTQGSEVMVAGMLFP